MEESLVKKVLPHSVEAEQSVIGAMLYAQDAIPAAMEYITGADFYQHSYGVIFDTLTELYRTGKATDIVTLQNALRAKDVAPEVYSLETLKDLLNSVFTSASIRSYAEIVQEKALLRRMIKTTEELTESYYLGKESTEDLLGKTEQKVFDLLEKRKDTASQPISDVMMQVIDEVEKASKTEGGITGLQTGFKDLDNMLLGFHPSELIIIAGRPSMGKTAFALNIAQYFTLKKDYSVAIFELEMPDVQLAKRLASMQSHVDSQKLRSGQLTNREWDDFVQASSEIAGTKLIIDATPGITLSELRTRCKKYQLEHGLDAVIVDYLQLMGSDAGSRSESRQQEVSALSRGLKALARELKVPVVVLSQLSRASEKREDHRPQMADLRESGAIEQDADVIMFLYRDVVYKKDTEHPDVAEIIVAKQRNGPVGKVYLKWISELTKFANLEKRDYPNAQGE